MAWRVGGVRVRTSEYWCDRLRAVEVPQAKRAASRCVVEARNLRCAMCDMPRATCEMRPTACGVRRVTRNAPCAMRHALHAPHARRGDRRLTRRAALDFLLSARRGEHRAAPAARRKKPPHAAASAVQPPAIVGSSVR
ncbi:hypothetical protein FE789_36115 [Burkholderia pseudomallei]|nr:hypothetical protein FE789_36115 [Burkholderia pseudomallei]